MKKLIPITILAMLIAGCSGGLVKPKVEKAIRNSLPTHIGPAREYIVRADGSDTSMLKGLIEHLHIEGTNVRLDPNLLVSRLIIDMDEVRYHPRTHELKTVKNTAFEATILEPAVNYYIQQTQESNPDVYVTLEPGRILVDVAPTVIGMDVRISVSGRPVIVDGDKISFQADKVSAANLPVPAYVVNKALERMNPILDMSVMQFPVTLHDITIRKGTVVIKGNAQFAPKSPGQ